MSVGLPEWCLAVGTNGERPSGRYFVVYRCAARHPHGPRAARGGGLARALAGHRGFTLIEVLIATAIATITMTGLFALLDAVTRSSANDQERSSALVEETAALHRMTGELGEAYQLLGPTTTGTSNYVEVYAWLTKGGATQTKERLVFDCEISSAISGERECVRYETPTTDKIEYKALEKDKEASASVTIPRVVNGTVSAPVFRLESPSKTGGGRPTYGSVSIETPAAGERAGYKNIKDYTYDITLSDSFYMRNLDFDQ